MREVKQKGTVRVAIAITFITAVCKILGFIKNSVLAYYFGTSPVVDAYVMTFSIGTITCGWIAGLIGNFTPVYKKVEADDGRDKALGFASNIHNFILLMVCVLAIVLEFLAPRVVNIIAPGFDEVTHGYTVYFFRLYLISILFYASYRFCNEFLNCNQKHIWASAPDILMSACCIISIIVSSFIGNSFLIYGYVIAIILQCALTQVGSYRIGFRIKGGMKWDKNIKALIVMAIPIFMSNTLAEINTLIDKIFASNLESGTVAALDYANTMKEFAFQIGTVAMVTMIFPILSKLWTDGDIENFKNKVMKGIDILAVFYIPLIAGIIVSGDLIINIVFKRGRFDDSAAVITTNAFIIYSVSLIVLVLRSVFFKAFYAMQKTKYILLVSGANVVLNILLNVILVRRLGYIGLAIATCFAALTCLPVYFVLFKRSIPSVRFRAFLIKTFKSVIAASVMYGLLRLLREYVFDGLVSRFWVQLGVLIIIAVIGVAIYITVGCLMGIEEVDEILNYCKKRFKRY